MSPLFPCWSLLLRLWPVAHAAPPADAVLLPAGRFEIGAAGLPDNPPHKVVLDAFLLDRTEVSVAAFEDFVRQGWRDPALWSPEGLAWREAHPDGAGAANRQAGRPSDHPVVAVSFYEAEAYCRWAGGRLPTEAEWERAACGGDGRRYPWGDDETVAAAWYDGGKYGQVNAVNTRPVTEAAPASTPASGLLHMAGNVWEWTSSAYSRDPAAPAAGPWRSLRGGSFMNLPSYATCTHREPARPDRVAFSTGFRCAYPTP